MSVFELRCLIVDAIAELIGTEADRIGFYIPLKEVLDAVGREHNVKDVRKKLSTTLPIHYNTRGITKAMDVAEMADYLVSHPQT